MTVFVFALAALALPTAWPEAPRQLTDDEGVHIPHAAKHHHRIDAATVARRSAELNQFDPSAKGMPTDSGAAVSRLSSLAQQFMTKITRKNAERGGGKDAGGISLGKGAARGAGPTGGGGGGDGAGDPSALMIQVLLAVMTTPAGSRVMQHPDSLTDPQVAPPPPRPRHETTTQPWSLSRLETGTPSTGSRPQQDWNNNDRTIPKGVT